MDYPRSGIKIKSKIKIKNGNKWSYTVNGYDSSTLPPDAVRMPDESKVVQDVVVKPNNILFQRHVAKHQRVTILFWQRNAQFATD